MMASRWSGGGSAGRGRRGNHSDFDEEGELAESGGETSDEDYSPGSLVIDATYGDISSLSSAPPTPPISRIQSTLEYDTHPIFPSTTTTHPGSAQGMTTPTQHNPPFSSIHPPALDEDDDIITTLSSLAGSQPSHGHYTHVSDSQAQGGRMSSGARHSNLSVKSEAAIPLAAKGGMRHAAQAPPISSSSPIPSASGVGGSGGGKVVVSFVTKVEIASEGSSPVDVICVYQYHWGSTSIDILSRNNKATLIPIKNVYNKAIPNLKQNVLSARISKLGIRSLVLPEPYVSCLKKLSMGLTGSSHYITIPDFIKICTYFKHPPPDDIMNFTVVTSVVPTSDVLLIFNNPTAESSVKLLSQLSEESKLRSSQENSANTGGSSGGANRSDHQGATGSEGGSRSKSGSKGGEVDESYINSGEIDARMLTLPNGSPIYVFVREGLVYIPNPELTKILPAVSRTAMENIRNTYGITVYQASKAEITFLKYFGVVSPKAGRTLVYKMSDVAKMYKHWNLSIPGFVKEICDGKVPEEKVELGASGTGLLLSPSPSSPHWSQSDESFTRSGTPHSVASSSGGGGGSGGVTPGITGSSTKSRHHLHRPSDLTTVSSVQNTSMGGGQNSLLTFGSTVDESYDGVDIKQERRRFSGLSPVINSASLTPERFQQPVKMLNSLQQGQLQLSPATSGHVIGNSNPMMTSLSSWSGHVESMAAVNQQMMSPFGAKLERFGKEEKRRRSSSSSVAPLDDQNLEYHSLMWGDESLTLLCPSVGEEPHLALPELIQKVYRFRSFVSGQRRSRLGVTIVPASSLQIHALRARGSLDSTPGSTKLVSLSDAVKLAVDGNLQIPGSVILVLKNYYKDQNLDSILNPAYLPLPYQQQADGEVDDASSNGSSTPTTGKRGIPFAPPPHPDIINCGPSSRTVEGMMCLVRWGNDKLVVYTTNKGIHYMGLYQVYETLFRKYVTRMNFKVRMRKHDIRSIRAPSDVRVKLIDLNALPPHCPVCGLIRVPEMERLAKSYGITPPSVFYDVFKAGEAVSPVASTSSSKKAGKSKKVEGVQKSRPKKVATEGIVHQFASPGGIGQSPSMSHGSVGRRGDGTANVFGGGVVGNQNSYGIVPYLTSSRDEMNRSRDGILMTSPGVIMTSSAPVSTDQITLGLGSDSGSLIVSIPRNLTPYKVATPTHGLGFNPLLTENSSMPVHPNSQRPIVHYGGTRSRVLQNLAKKITQKSRKFTSGLNSSSVSSSGGNYTGGQLRKSSDDPSSSGGRDYSGNVRVCPSCNQMSPSIKKSCQHCGEFLVGKICPSCGALNHNRIKECAKCLTPMKNSESPKGSFGGGASDTSSSHPTSPLSPKFSAPPIRSAALKTMFPQSSDGLATGPSVSVTSTQQQQQQQQQLMTKTMFSGNLASTRKCLECGQLNSKMAKKCMQCKSHLQGRPCHRCGRPNLNHVTECYKCGATLAPTANKWVYVGSHSGRAYKRPQDPEQELLQSRAPVTCVRCHKLRTNNHFKCGRCGDLFRCRAVILQPWEEGEESKDLQPPTKKRKELRESQNHEETPPVDAAVVNQFAHNLLSLDVAEQLTSLISEAEERTREKIPAVEQGWEDIETEYQAFLVKKEDNDKSYRDTQAELDGLMKEVESYNNQLQVILVGEKDADELVKTLPEEIKKLEEKIESASKLLLFSHDP